MVAGQSPRLCVWCQMYSYLGPSNNHHFIRGRLASALAVHNKRRSSGVSEIENELCSERSYVGCTDSSYRMIVLSIESSD